MLRRQRSADSVRAEVKTTKKLSPSVPISRPCQSRTSSRIMERWTDSASPYCIPNWLSNRVEPSMSLNSKVTVPEWTGCSTTSV